MLEKIMTNEDIQFQWSILSIDIEEEEDGTKLLHEIVTLWLTIRGFSQAAAWMEILKREESEAKRRSKAHRKGLKRKLEEEGGKSLSTSYKHFIHLVLELLSIFFLQLLVQTMLQLSCTIVYYLQYFHQHSHLGKS